LGSTRNGKPVCAPPKTVEVNFSRIYRKLRIRSRMELYRAWESGNASTPPE